MIELFSTEFWIVLLFFVHFFLVIFLFLLVRKVNRLNDRKFSENPTNEKQKNADLASGTASEIMEMLEPFVKESKKVAVSFDEQIGEKKRLLKDLNDTLDSKIISINLFLSRAEAMQKKLERRYDRTHSSFPATEPFDLQSASGAVLDQQTQIVEMYHQGTDIDSIAQRLSIPKGEVQLVIDLKKKFISMEKNSK